MRRRRLVAVLAAVVLLAIPAVRAVSTSGGDAEAAEPASSQGAEVVPADGPVVEPGLDRFQLIPLAPDTVTFQFLEHRPDAADPAGPAGPSDGREAGTRV